MLTSWMFLKRKPLMNSLHQEPSTMPLNSMKDSPQSGQSLPTQPQETRSLQSICQWTSQVQKDCFIQIPTSITILLCTKKDGSIRPCQDYQYLNSHTIKNTYLLSLISNLIDKLKGSLIFTKIDIQWGYNNVLIKPEDRWKAVFVTLLGLFKPTVIFLSYATLLPPFRHWWTTSLAIS